MKFFSFPQIHRNKVMNYWNFWLSLRNWVFTRQGGACKRKILSINAGQSRIIPSLNPVLTSFRCMGRICFPFKQSFLFSYAPTTSHCHNLLEKEIEKDCQKGYSYRSSVPERSREFENSVGVNLILDISWVILQTQEEWLVQIKARIRS